MDRGSRAIIELYIHICKRRTIDRCLTCYIALAPTTNVLTWQCHKSRSPLSAHSLAIRAQAEQSYQQLRLGLVLRQQADGRDVGSQQHADLNEVDLTARERRRKRQSMLKLASRGEGLQRSYSFVSMKISLFVSDTTASI